MHETASSSRRLQQTSVRMPLTNYAYWFINAVLQLLRGCITRYRWSCWDREAARCDRI